MAISHARKKELLSQYIEQLGQSQGIILAHYTKLTVPQLQALRRQAREQEGQIFVVKNTLLAVALKNHGLEVPTDLLTGPTLAAFCHKEAPPLAKIFKEFAKENRENEEKHFIIRGAIVEGHYYTAEQTRQLADLPGRDQLFAQVLRTINAPATQTAGVIAGGIRQVINVIKAYADKLEEGGIPAEAAA
ncbi:MAG: 50S ribosomal protein L10 [Chloroflexi bacterium]|nr:MAG: 50S ribosomal protein L10 [Chloroflexota bacterium]